MVLNGFLLVFCGRPWMVVVMSRKQETRKKLGLFKGICSTKKRF